MEKREICGTKEAPLFSWPWENLGNFKYLLYAPLVAKVGYGYYKGEANDGDWCFHVLNLLCLRAFVHQLWSSYSCMYFLNRTRRVNQSGIEYNQIDSEWHWDNFFILQTAIASFLVFSFPSLEKIPIWDFRGFLCCFILHTVISEPLYYWLHRLLHTSDLFHKYHWLHHSSKVLHPFTAEHLTFFEHLLLCVVVGIPLLGTTAIGYGSRRLMYGYLLVFDFLQCLGYSNVEIFPYQIFDALPVLKHLIRTPTYHSLHHSEMNTNFCLFMPLFDKLWKTQNPKSWELQRAVSSRKTSRVPDFVFLAHVVDVMSSIHASFVFRSFNSTPFSVKPYLLTLWPGSYVTMLLMWAKSKTFLFSFYHLRGKLCHTWVVPRYGFQYFLPFAKEGINKQIEDAILRADRLGVKVISLAALNKNEALNGGGVLFTNKHPELKVRICHGNTLTAAVILNDIPKEVDEVFLTGATSKLGRAITLYLARRKVKVMMLTLSAERFTKIQKEAPPEFQMYLVQVTKYQAAKHCKTWILGKWATPQEQYSAPSGTHFHQFVVPPVLAFRRDCTYGNLAAMRLPDDVEGLGSCEYMLGRGIVHACHAGGLVHSLEGWKHHEVGAIDVDQIDVVWEAALSHGLRPVG